MEPEKTDKPTPTFEPSGMTCFIIVDDNNKYIIRSKLVDAVERIKDSCMGTLIDQWILVGDMQAIEGYSSAPTLKSAISLRHSKNKWSIIMYPGETFEGDIPKFLVSIYTQSDFKICSLNIANCDKNGRTESTEKSIRLFKRGVNINKLYQYGFEHFLTHKPTYIKKIGD